MERRCYGCMKLKQEPVCEHCGYDETAENDAHQLPVGTVVGNQYILGRVLGQGGFGITYIGWDKIMQMPVAVKEYFPSGFAGRDTTVNLQVRSYDNQKSHVYEGNRRRFLREAESLAKLWNIPQIVRVLRCFEENNTAYIVMEYVEGMDLKRYLQKKGRKLTARETFGILRPVMEALEYVHRANLVHRDISPDNIMILPDGSAKLLDFGAARYVENPDAEGALNTSTQAILKHGFAPPEQYQSRGALGPWTDIYAMCATAYYCLSGKVPVESMSRMMEDAQIDWSCVSPLTQRERAILEKGLALKPKDRFASMQQLYEALIPRKNVAAEKKDSAERTAQTTVPERTRKETSPLEKKAKPRYQKKKKKGRGLLLAAVAAALAVVLGVTAIGLGGSREAPSMAAPPMATAAGIPHMGAPAAEAPPLESTAVDQQAKVFKIGVAIYSYADTFMAEYRSELENYFEKQQTGNVSYEITMFDANNDAATQMEQVDTMIMHGVDLILLNLVQPQNADVLIDKVNSAGIPLILINRQPMGEQEESYPGIVNNRNVCFVGTDPRMAGYVQGQILVNQHDRGDINGDGMVSYVMIIGDPENPESQCRTEYALKALAEAGVPVVCLVENVGNWNPAKGQEITAAALAQYGSEVEVVFCNNDGMAEGAAAAIESAGYVIGDDIYLLGIDGTTAAMEMVRNGTMTGTVWNAPGAQARKAAEVAVAALNGEKLQNYYWVDYVPITAAYFGEN